MNGLRILHCPSMVGGNPQGLVRAERQLGLASWSISLERNIFDYPADEVLATKGAGALITELRRWLLLRRALRDYDIIHFNFGQSLMPAWHAMITYPRLLRWPYQHYASVLELRDLAWLKKAGKGIFVTFQGDDARQGDFCRNHFPITFANEVGPDYYPAGSDEHKRWRISQFARYADRIYALNPDLLHVLPASAQFLPYANVDFREWRIRIPEKPITDQLLLVHAPTHREVKGTRFVVDAVARLQAEGVAVQLVLVENMTNAEARRVYEQADLFVDQMLAGWYGGAAVELMAMGKPVIAYIREQDLHFIPAAMRRACPVIRAEPKSLYAVLKEWLTIRREELPERGKQSRTYVEQWHDPLKIAARVKADYELIWKSHVRNISPVKP